MTPDELQTLRNRLSSRLNDHLCGMKPDYDDSIAGFNEAWDVMRKVFDDEAARMAQPVTVVFDQASAATLGHLLAKMASALDERVAQDERERQDQLAQRR